MRSGKLSFWGSLLFISCRTWLGIVYGEGYLQVAYLIPWHILYLLYPLLFGVKLLIFEGTTATI